MSLSVQPVLQESRTNSFTSTGAKLFAHTDAINHYLRRDGHHIIDAQVAPTNACNLHCTYCNQEERDKSKSLPFETITKWLAMLKERGLKAVIITGGGEPTLYPHFNKLVKWLDDNNLARALITNGTNGKTSGGPVNFDGFDWIRVSLNQNSDGSFFKLAIPKERKSKGILGFSMVYTNQNEDAIKSVADIANNYNAKYVRILPDSCQPLNIIQEVRKKLQDMVARLNLEKIIFVQTKDPEQAKVKICHHAFFRPFLLPDGKVAPCDCFMMNKAPDGEPYKTLPAHFNIESEEGNPMSYADFLDGKWIPSYSPLVECNNCSLNQNNAILDTFVQRHNESGHLAEETMQEEGWKIPTDITHENYI